MNSSGSTTLSFSGETDSVPGLSGWNSSSALRADARRGDPRFGDLERHGRRRILENRFEICLAAAVILCLR